MTNFRITHTDIDNTEEVNPFTIARLLNPVSTVYNVVQTESDEELSEAHAADLERLRVDLERAASVAQTYLSWHRNTSGKLERVFGLIREYIVENDVQEHDPDLVEALVNEGMEPLVKKYSFEVEVTFTLSGMVEVPMNCDEAEAEEAIKEAIAQEYYRSSDYDDGDGTTVQFEGSCAEVQVESCYLSQES